MSTTLSDHLPTDAAGQARETARPVRGRWRAAWRGRATDPRWVRPALVILLACTALLYLCGLGASGWANGFYTAAVQAGSESWKAFFFGSFDASSFITVDKPPVALWVMEVSVRLFGLSSWSVLVPEALEGVAAVGLLYLTVRRRFSPAAALLAGAVLALTPVAVLMFRFNNPDALLVLLLVAAAYAMVRAVERAGTGWLLLAATLVGTGFLTKMLQAFLVLPAFALVYLLTAPASLRRRLVQLVTAAAAVVIASGWWVAVVQLVPATARPYIGGSQDNSLLGLVFGYNGFGRLTGNETGSVGGGPGGSGGRWGATGWGRMFGSEFGTQISWLLPAALVFLVALLWLSRRLHRTDGRRAQVLLWGGWLLVTAATFSFAQGIIHPYYSVALAPAVAALVGIGALELWPLRDRAAQRTVLTVAVAATTVWALVLLDRAPSWHPGLRVVVLVAGAVATLTLALAPVLGRRLVATGAVAALGAGLLGPGAYAVDTAASPHTGALPSAGPAVAGGRFPGSPFGGHPGHPGHPRGGFLGLAGGQLPSGPTAGGFRPRPGGPRGRPGGGLLDASTPSAAVVAALRADSDSYTWVAAAVGANNAAGYQIAARQPVMAIGGFNGTDPAPTLPRFRAYVRAGKIHYFIVAGGPGAGFGGFGRGRGSSSAITSWVTQHFARTTVGGVTMYDLTRRIQPSAGGRDDTRQAV